MDCEQFREFIPAWLEGSLEGNELDAFKWHMMNCRECCEILRMLTGQQEVDTTVIPSVFKDEIRKSLKKERFYLRLEQVLKWLLPACTFIFIGIIALFIILEKASIEKPAWELKDIAGVRSDNYPVVREDRLILVRQRNDVGVLIAVDKLNGNEIWTGKDSVAKNIVADGPRVYCWVKSGDKYKLTAFSIYNGRKVWQHPHEVEAVQVDKLPPVSLSSTELYFHTKNMLFAVKRTNGLLKWRTDRLEGKVLSDPHIAGKFLCLASEEQLFFVEKENGNIAKKFRFLKEQGTAEKPLLDSHDKYLFMVQRLLNGSGSIWCFDIKKEGFAWRKKQQNVHQLKVQEGIVFLRSTKIDALLPNGGKRLWSKSIGGCSPMYLTSNHIYTAGNQKDSEIFSINLQNGEVEKSYKLGKGTCTGLAINGDKAYIRTHAGKLVAVKMAN